MINLISGKKGSTSSWSNCRRQLTGTLLARRATFYINFACLYVCPFVSKKRQNGWTDPDQIFCGTLNETPVKVYGCLKLQTLVSKSFWKFVKSWYARKNILKSAIFCCCYFKLYVHRKRNCKFANLLFLVSSKGKCCEDWATIKSLNRIMARSAPNSLGVVNFSKTL